MTESDLKILAVSSGKGGVGKTTVTLNIARQLSLAGFRTLIIDFDIHNKGATCLFMDKVAASTVRSVSQVMSDCGAAQTGTEARFDQFEILDLGYDQKLFLIPAARPDEMIRWQNFVCDTEKIVEYLGSFVRTLAVRNRIDVVLIDCYGGVDTLTLSAAGIADDFIIINEPDVITFAGTLLLYKQLQATYGSSAKPPRVHFVINRISGRYSFAFLQTEYHKHLSELAVDRSVLAYLPFDKLVFDTFGDYAFFSELLPKGLYARKIRELIARLWTDSKFVKLSAKSARRRQKIYEATAENPFADPERIFQVWKTAPGWALLPITALLLLYIGPTARISFLTLRTTFYLCVVFVFFVVLVAVLFEPWQITRWLLRKSNYERRRRRLLFGSTVGSRMRAILDLGLSWMPRAIGVLCFGLILLMAIGMDLFYPFRNLGIWKREIGGFYPQGMYNGLILRDGALVTPETNLSGSWLVNADLSSALLPIVKLDGAHLRHAKLEHAKFVGDTLRNADFTLARLESADLSASLAAEADFTGTDLVDASLWAADLSEANFSRATLYRTDFRQSILRDATFDGAYLKDTKFEGADLTGADFSEANFYYINDDERVELFSQLMHQGAKLSDDQIEAAKRWEASVVSTHCGKPDKNPNREGTAKQWWFDWKMEPAQPARLKSDVEPFIYRLSWILDHGPGSAEVNDSNSGETFATLADLVELLVIRGTPDDFEQAHRRLDLSQSGLERQQIELQEEISRFGKKPRVPSDRSSTATEELGDLHQKLDGTTHNLGVILLLKLELSIASQDGSEELALKNWQNWLSKQPDQQLIGWSWDVWDTNFPARRYSQTQNARLRAVHLSAEQSLDPPHLRKWFLPANPQSNVHIADNR